MLNGGPHIDEYGIQRWFRDGERHRVDGPAVICADGTECWYLDDKLHRLDGPAVVSADGSEFWYLNGNYLGEGSEGFWAHWEKLNNTQRCNLNLHKWLVKYT